MNKYFLVFALFFWISGQVSLAQISQNEKVVVLVKEGVTLYDDKKYEEALKKLQAALKIEKNNLTVHYEIALTYLALKDYKNTIKHADIIIKNKENYEYAHQAFDLKGTTLDVLGKREEAISNYEKGIETYPKYALLHFNKGITLLRLKRNKEAEVCFKNTLEINPSHHSSHYFLSVLANERGDKIQTILSSAYFLLLEPDSKRSETVYKYLSHNLQKLLDKEKKDGTVTINLSSTALDDPESLVIKELFFIPLDKLDSLNIGTKLTVPANANDLQKRFYKFCEVLQKFGSDAEKKNIWQNLYISFFNELSKTTHLEAASYLLSLPEYAEPAKEWLEKNQTNFKDFAKWYSDFHKK
jgi:tetratricopeptide (TPR) repeat protein